MTFQIMFLSAVMYSQAMMKERPHFTKYHLETEMVGDYSCIHHSVHIYIYTYIYTPIYVYIYTHLYMYYWSYILVYILLYLCVLYI